MVVVLGWVHGKERKPLIKLIPLVCWHHATLPVHRVVLFLVSRTHGKELVVQGRQVLGP